jgi:hypothetical protein
MSTSHSLKRRHDISGWGFTKNTRGVTNYCKIGVGLLAYSGPHKKSGKASGAWVRKAGYSSGLYTEFTEEQLLAAVNDIDICQFNDFNQKKETGPNTGIWSISIKGWHKGGVFPSNIFFLSKNIFWLLSSRGANKKLGYSVHDKLGRVKTEQIKNCVYGTQNGDVWVTRSQGKRGIVNFYPPLPPNSILPTSLTKLRLCISNILRFGQQKM